MPSTSTWRAQRPPAHAEGTAQAGGKADSPADPGQCGGSRVKAMELLGLSKTVFYGKLKEYQLD